MPNGNPKFQEEELPNLESFFSALADTLMEFAAKHNLRVERYYHQMPSWTFSFKHPKGGVASVEVWKEPDDSVIICSNWWLDNYVMFTRYIKGDEGTAFRMGDENLEQILEAQFRKILSWQLNAWTKVITSYESAWSPLGKEWLEMDVERYPKPKV